ncbi:uncharacterized protein KY384_008832 [Bacidia gigantensis]|uniref:uncharacterized protein n=1 Tax=Bacidia gigantensis TaxID=2732470 RepID=UPI001D05C00D|nr:uncharacterized protein KY384_008832 [Bacidia gigantensis]KAG8526631.1 hypothetical protein KY384_008832 [Bacidia gigantensis]
MSNYSSEAHQKPLANETSVTSTTTSASGAATLAPQDDLSKATAKPPDFDDFKDFFTNKDNNIKRHMLVFWSGTGIDDPQTFAGRQDRFTLEMIVGTKWKQYQTDKAHGGYWKTWYDCVDGFWTPASDALSSVATGDVAVILSADADYLQQQEDPTHATCPTCWYNTEKPNLIHNLLKGSVAGIFKYHTPLPAKYIGKITSMGDKL